MKRLRPVLFFLLVGLIVPQVAFAVWWNPSSWFSNWSFLFKTDTKTQTLEKRIEELEKKLVNTSSSTALTTQIQVPDKRASTTVQEKQKPTIVPVISSNPVQPKVKVASTTLSVSPPATNTPRTFTTPNGAIIDEAGNIISPPRTASQLLVPPSLSAGSRVFTSEEIYSLVSPSVVLIIASKGNGSGLVINYGKYTLTNAHVIGSDQTVQLRLQSGVSFSGVVLGKNDTQDLALIFNGSQRPQAVTLGSSGDPLKIGTDVYALGYPLSISEGLSAVTFTRGTLSAKQAWKGYPGTVLQTDAAINHGNSGGPLVNNKGEVVGVNTFGLNGEAQGIYFAIPIQTAIDLIPTLSNYGQSRIEVYPIGSTMSIKRSMLMRVGYNDTLSCEALGFIGVDLTLCNLYKDYGKDYNWAVVEDVSR